MGIMEKKMENTILGLGFRVVDGSVVSGSRVWGQLGTLFTS